MSSHVKINAALLSIIGSALATSVWIVWLASARASDIDTAKHDIQELKEAERDTGLSLSRLDERTVLMLKKLEAIEARLK